MMTRCFHAVRRAALITAAAGLLALLGCSSSGFSSNPLASVGFSRGTAGLMDGFVFVPSRAGFKQTASGNTLPDAIITVYQLNGAAAPTLLFTSQADDTGHYSVAGMPLDVPLLIKATVPFSNVPGQTQNSLEAIVSFSSTEDNKTRNINNVSTVAADACVDNNAADPLSDAQVTALETVAQQLLNQNPNIDPTTNAAGLAALAASEQQEAFGSYNLAIFSTPPVAATVLINGAQAGTINTLTPGSAASSNVQQFTSIPSGDADIEIDAPGFQPAIFTITIVGGQTTNDQRTLVSAPVAGQSFPPVIVDERVTPPSLPFEGGTVSVQAILQDPQNHAITASATAVVLSTTGRQTLSPITLAPIGNNVYSGNLTAPGNPTVVPVTYEVTISASTTQNPTPVTAVVDFQVAGTNPPPPAPTTTTTTGGTTRH
jgi:hypothetical protein